MGSLAQLYGNVGIDILAYTVDGRTVEVRADAKPFTVVGDIYENPWLGVRLRKPANYRYKQLDVVWPQPGIVVLEGLNGDIVTLDRIEGAPERYLERQGIQGQPRSVQIGVRAGYEIVSGSKAALVVPVEDESWVVLVESPAAGDLLRRAMKWLDLGSGR